MTFAIQPTSGARGTPQTGILHQTNLSTQDTIRVTNSLQETQAVGAETGQRSADTQPGEGMERAIRRQVRAVLAGMYPLSVPHARRTEERFPFPRLLRLIPSTVTGMPNGKEVTVVGKQLSERGLGFFHPGPLPHRWVIVELEVANGARYSFLLQLLWCRFLREGWYESGGRFSKLLEAPSID